MIEVISLKRSTQRFDDNFSTVTINLLFYLVSRRWRYSLSQNEQSKNKKKEFKVKRTFICTTDKRLFVGFFFDRLIGFFFSFY